MIIIVIVVIIIVIVIIIIIIVILVLISIAIQQRLQSTPRVGAFAADYPTRLLILRSVCSQTPVLTCY